MPDRSSKKQQELLQFIDGFIKGNGYGPSYREVMRALGYKSVSTVAVHIDGLIARGYLRKRGHSARSLEVITLGDATRRSLSAGQEWVRSEIRRLLEEGNLPDEDSAALRRVATLLGVKESEATHATTE